MEPRLEKGKAVLKKAYAHNVQAELAPHQNQCALPLNRRKAARLPATLDKWKIRAPRMYTHWRLPYIGIYSAGEN